MAPTARRLTIAAVQRAVGKAVLDRLMSTERLSGPEEHGRSTVIGWIIDAVGPERAMNIGSVLPLDVFSWPAASRASNIGGGAPWPKPPPDPPGAFLTAGALNPANSVFHPETLDLPLPEQAALETTDATRHALLEYLNHLTWGQSEGTPDDLRQRLDKAVGRLHEVALIVQAAYDAMAAEMDEQHEERARARSTAQPHFPPPEADDDDQRPF
jgi:hypothetical protein